MSEEEKEAIDDLKLAIEQEKEELPYSKESLKNKQAILNYIDKLQKELEEYKNLCLMFSNERDKIIKEEMELQKENKELKKELEKANKQLDLDYVDNNFISKDIIRDKIKELEVKFKKHEGEGLSGFFDKLDVGTRIDVLKELLGE